MKRSELIMSALLIPLDALMLIAAFVAAYYLRDNVTLVTPEMIGSLSAQFQYNPASAIGPFSQYLRYILWLIPCMIAIFALTGLYNPRMSARFPQRFGRIVLGVSGGLFFILLLFLFKRDFFLPRTTVLYSWVLGIVFVTAGRLLVRLAQHGLYRMGIGAVRVAVLGTTEMAQTLVKRLSQGGIAQYVWVNDLPNESVEDILPVISRDRMDELVVVNERYSIDDLLRLRNRCLEQHVGFGFVPRAFTALQGAAYEIRDQVGLPMIQVRPTPLDGWGRITKRLFDLIIGTLLVIIATPFYVIISLLIRLTSPGAPLIFRHKRIGRGGEPIYVSKYRTMKPGWSDTNGKLAPQFATYLEKHPEAAREWKETMKLKHDPRISAVGTFLRATRLDELPQFFDVLRGDLSLVGPRPIIAEEVSRFGEQARILFHVRPGVTGPWQVAGGNTLSYDERVRLNTHYIEHWSIWLDLIILAKTVAVLLGGLWSRITGKPASEDAY
jgi:exopolysaccharide biosynthesis polyprenyl glycosylphosphotransferase